MGWGQILTLRNDPSRISALRVVMKYKLHWNWMGSNYDPTCNFASRVVTIYKLHWYGVGSNFNVEKLPYLNIGSTCIYKIHWDGMGSFNVEKMTLHVVWLHV